MATQNWSYSLFSLDGAFPVYLPARFRLTNGFTRYSANCTLEDIFSAGYTGPYTFPSIKSNEFISWDLNSLSFVVTTKETSDSSDPILIDKEVRQWAYEQLKALPDLNNPAYDTTYQADWGAYSSSLIQIVKYSDNSLLTFEDLPAIPTVPYNQSAFDKAAAQAIIDDNLERWKEQYEIYGFIFYVALEVRPYFSIPPDWIPGSSPLPSGTSPYFPESLPSQSLP